jgi:hypothetical protein
MRPHPAVDEMVAGGGQRLAMATHDHGFGGQFLRHHLLPPRQRVAVGRGDAIAFFYNRLRGEAIHAGPDKAERDIDPFRVQPAQQFALIARNELDASPTVSPRWRRRSTRRTGSLAISCPKGARWGCMALPWMKPMAALASAIWSM